MKYFTAIATLLGLNLVSVITLLYFSGISKEIEKENKILEMQIGLGLTPCCKIPNNISMP